MRFRSCVVPAGPHRTISTLVAAMLMTLLAATPGAAWIYPEHREIAGAAISGLDPDQKRALDALWRDARSGHEDRLCEEPFAGDQGLNPPCIDLAAWPSFAGDHSCSAAGMLDTILQAKWVLGVAHVGARTEKRLASSKSPAQRQNYMTLSNLELERTDPEYSTRAGANIAHFLLPDAGEGPESYTAKSTAAGAELNADGIYIRYHLAAIRLAAELGRLDPPPGRRDALARVILACEAYGLHFLEDAFAAGHVAGTWGPNAQRKGTHDFYNEQGLATTTWSGRQVVIAGDAHMRPEDVARAAATVRESLSHVLEALGSGSALARGVERVPLDEAERTAGLNTCGMDPLPPLTVPEDMKPLLAAVFMETPVPARGPGLGSLPRFQSEIGPFLGLATGLWGAGMRGGLFAENGGGTAPFGALDVGVRGGFGLDALIGKAGDGQVFLQLGILYQSASRTACGSACNLGPLADEIVPLAPARQGISVRFRAPFWLIPGDLVLAAPILAITSPRTLEKMTITAADGGLIPWQSGIASPIGRFQFVLGREIGATFFGYTGHQQAFIVQSGTTPQGQPVYVPVTMRSIELDFPLVEYRPFRDFTTHQTFTLLLQLGGGLSLPRDVKVIPPFEGPTPEIGTGYFLYIRLAFDWRRYL